jgi:hypothetical protein
MENSIKEMIELLDHEHRNIDDEFARIDKKFTKIRDDFGIEVGRAKEKSINLGEAIAILSKEYSQKPNDSRLSSDAYKQIMEWLNKPHSF